MDLLFAVTELFPYVKVGGLADVAAALPKALRAAGHRVTIVAPKLPAYEEAGLLLARRLTPISFLWNGSKIAVTAYDGRLSSQVDLLLLDLRVALPGNPIYGDSSAGTAAFFALFSRAVAEVAKVRAAGGAAVDAVHAHDWPTALVPTFLRALKAEEPALAKTKSVLTIHNAAHQGIFPKAALKQIGIDAKLFAPNGIEFHGRLNFLKLGVLHADAVTTVSATYARELLTEEGGFGLQGVFSEAASKTSAILNGIDYAVWNPATDSAIAVRYDAEDASAKGRCKTALQKDLGLVQGHDLPLFGFVGRLVAQKGVDLIYAMLPKLLARTEAQFVFAGEGEDVFADALTALAQKHPTRVAFLRGASEAQVHRIFAGADFALVPSRHEPCGLVQQYAARYGALPVAHRAGGLVDTVVDCDAALETGTGFLFSPCETEALHSATDRALAAFVSPRFADVRRRIMRLDRSWDRSARRYERVYGG